MKIHEPFIVETAVSYYINQMDVGIVRVLVCVWMFLVYLSKGFEEKYTGTISDANTNFHLIHWSIDMSKTFQLK